MDPTGWDTRDADAEVEKLLVEIAAEKDPQRQRELRQGLAEAASPMKLRPPKPTQQQQQQFPAQQQPMTVVYALVAALAAVGVAAFYYKLQADSLQQVATDLHKQLEARKKWSAADSDAGTVVSSVWPWQWPWQVLVGVSIFFFLCATILGTLLSRGGVSHGVLRPGRMAPIVEGSFVVLLIGIKPHSLLQFWKWMPIVRAMVNMGKELEQKKDSGFMGYEVFVGLQPLIIQYWRSFDHMRQCPAPKWVALTQKSHLEPTLGVWHETYLIRSGDYEGVYSNMPSFGLGKVAEEQLGGRLVEAKGKLATAAGRLGLEVPPSPAPGTSM